MLQFLLHVLFISNGLSEFTGTERSMLRNNRMQQIDNLQINNPFIKTSEQLSLVNKKKCSYQCMLRWG